jgi:NTP pyrophosphatase (non-canonical NTP hydrolase)
MADAGGAVAGANADGVTLASAATTPGGDLTLARLRGELAAFAAERDWNQFHTPRNLCMALSGEIGEVSECFQWRSDADCAVGLPTWSAKDKQALGEELSDCAFAMRLRSLLLTLPHSDMHCCCSRCCSAALWTPL